MASALESQSDDSFESARSENRHTGLDSDDSSNFGSLARNVDSDEFGELEGSEPDLGQVPQEQLKSPSKEEFRKFDKPNIASCKISPDLLDKLKRYIFIQAQTEDEFSIEDLRIEFSDNFEVPEDVDLEMELAKMGIVKLKYAPGNKLKLVPRPDFIWDFYEEKSTAKVN